MVLASNNSFGSGGGGLTVSAGTLILQGANAYTGATTVNTTAGLTLNLVGSLPSTSGITVNTGGTLTYDNNTTASVANRIPTSTSISLNGANLTYIANNNIGFNSTATLGTVTLTAGNTTITSGPSAAAVIGVNSTLTIGTLNRSGNDATVNFTNTQVGATIGSAPSQVVISTLGTNAGTISVTNGGNILPYASVTGNGNLVDIANQGAMLNLEILIGGTGYLSGTTGTEPVTITGGGGTGATAIATVTSGVITAVTITSQGYGYTSPPTITISDSPVTVAVITASLSSSSSNPIQIGPFGGYITAISNSTSPNDVVKETANETMFGNKTIAALVLASGVTVTEAGYTLTVGNGTFAPVISGGATANTINTGTLALNGQGFILQPYSAA